MNPDYARTAHRKAVYAELVRVLQDGYLTGETPAKKKIQCEDAFYRDREVSEEAVHEVLERVLQLQLEEERNLQKYELKKRHEQETSEKIRKPTEAERSSPSARPTPGRRKPGRPRSTAGSA